MEKIPLDNERSKFTKTCIKCTNSAKSIFKFKILFSIIQRVESWSCINICVFCAELSTAHSRLFISLYYKCHHSYYLFMCVRLKLINRFVLQRDKFKMDYFKNERISSIFSLDRRDLLTSLVEPNGTNNIQKGRKRGCVGFLEKWYTLRENKVNPAIFFITLW